MVATQGAAGGLADPQIGLQQSAELHPNWHCVVAWMLQTFKKPIATARQSQTPKSKHLPWHSSPSGSQSSSALVALYTPWRLPAFQD